jgi:hypothetical protein
MPKKNRQQQPTNPAKSPSKPTKRKVAPWMSDNTRVVFSGERVDDG